MDNMQKPIVREEQMKGVTRIQVGRGCVARITDNIINNFKFKLMQSYFDDNFNAHLAKSVALECLRRVKSRRRCVREIPIFADTVRNFIFFLHEYNMKVFKSSNSYPFSHEFSELLHQYVLLECQILYKRSYFSKEREIQAHDRTLRLLLNIFNDYFKSKMTPRKEVIEKSAKAIFDIFIELNLNYPNANKFRLLERMTGSLLKKIGRYDKVNAIKNKCVPSAVDSAKDPDLLIFSTNVMTSDYGSDETSNGPTNVICIDDEEDINKVPVEEQTVEIKQEPVISCIQSRCTPKPNMVWTICLDDDDDDDDSPKDASKDDILFLAEEIKSKRDTINKNKNTEVAIKTHKVDKVIQRDKIPQLPKIQTDIPISKNKINYIDRLQQIDNLLDNRTTHDDDHDDEEENDQKPDINTIFIEEILTNTKGNNSSNSLPISRRHIPTETSNQSVALTNITGRSKFDQTLQRINTNGSSKNGIEEEKDCDEKPVVEVLRQPGTSLIVDIIDLIDDEDEEQDAIISVAGDASPLARANPDSTKRLSDKNGDAINEADTTDVSSSCIVSSPKNVVSHCDNEISTTTDIDIISKKIVNIDLASHSTTLNNSNHVEQAKKNKPDSSKSDIEENHLNQSKNIQYFHLNKIEKGVIEEHVSLDGIKAVERCLTPVEEFKGVINLEQENKAVDKNNEDTEICMDIADQLELDETAKNKNRDDETSNINNKEIEGNKLIQTTSKDDSHLNETSIDVNNEEIGIQTTSKDDSHLHDTATYVNNEIGVHTTSKYDSHLNEMTADVNNTEIGVQTTSKDDSHLNEITTDVNNTEFGVQTTSKDDSDLNEPATDVNNEEIGVHTTSKYDSHLNETTTEVDNKEIGNDNILDDEILDNGINSQIIEDKHKQKLTQTTSKDDSPLNETVIDSVDEELIHDSNLEKAVLLADGKNDQLIEDVDETKLIKISCIQDTNVEGIKDNTSNSTSIQDSEENQLILATIICDDDTSVINLEKDSYTIEEEIVNDDNSTKLIEQDCYEPIARLESTQHEQEDSDVLYIDSNLVEEEAAEIISDEDQTFLYRQNEENIKTSSEEINILDDKIDTELVIPLASLSIQLQCINEENLTATTTEIPPIFQKTEESTIPEHVEANKNEPDSFRSNMEVMNVINLEQVDKAVCREDCHENNEETESHIGIAEQLALDEMVTSRNREDETSNINNIEIEDNVDLKEDMLGSPKNYETFEQMEENKLGPSTSKNDSYLNETGIDVNNEEIGVDSTFGNETLDNSINSQIIEDIEENKLISTTNTYDNDTSVINVEKDKIVLNYTTEEEIVYDDNSSKPNQKGSHEPIAHLESTQDKQEDPDVLYIDSNILVAEEEITEIINSDGDQTSSYPQNEENMETSSKETNILDDKVDTDLVISLVSLSIQLQRINEENLTAATTEIPPKIQKTEEATVPEHVKANKNEPDSSRSNMEDVIVKEKHLILSKNVQDLHIEEHIHLEGIKAVERGLTHVEEIKERIEDDSVNVINLEKEEKAVSKEDHDENNEEIESRVVIVEQLDLDETVTSKNREDETSININNKDIKDNVDLKKKILDRLKNCEIIEEIEENKLDQTTSKNDSLVNETGTYINNEEIGDDSILDKEKSDNITNSQIVENSEENKLITTTNTYDNDPSVINLEKDKIDLDNTTEEQIINDDNSTEPIQKDCHEPIAQLESTQEEQEDPDVLYIDGNLLVVEEEITEIITSDENQISLYPQNKENLETSSKETNILDDKVDTDLVIPLASLSIQLQPLNEENLTAATTEIPPKFQKTEETTVPEHVEANKNAPDSSRSDMEDVIVKEKHFIQSKNVQDLHIEEHIHLEGIKAVERSITHVEEIKERIEDGCENVIRLEKEEKAVSKEDHDENNEEIESRMVIVEQLDLDETVASKNREDETSININNKDIEENVDLKKEILDSLKNCEIIEEIEENKLDQTTSKNDSLINETGTYINNEEIGDDSILDKEKSDDITNSQIVEDSEENKLITTTNTSVNDPSVINLEKDKIDLDNTTEKQIINVDNSTELVQKDCHEPIAQIESTQEDPDVLYIDGNLLVVEEEITEISTSDENQISLYPQNKENMETSSNETNILDDKLDTELVIPIASLSIKLERMNEKFFTEAVTEIPPVFQKTEETTFPEHVEKMIKNESDSYRSNMENVILKENHFIQSKNVQELHIEEHINLEAIVEQSLTPVEEIKEVIEYDINLKQVDKSVGREDHDGNNDTSVINLEKEEMANDDNSTKLIEKDCHEPIAQLESTQHEQKYSDILYIDDNILVVEEEIVESINSDEDQTSFYPQNEENIKISSKETNILDYKIDTELVIPIASMSIQLQRINEENVIDVATEIPPIFQKTEEITVLDHVEEVVEESCIDKEQQVHSQVAVSASNSTEDNLNKPLDEFEKHKFPNYAEFNNYYIPNSAIQAEPSKMLILAMAAEIKRKSEKTCFSKHKKKTKKTKKAFIKATDDPQDNKDAKMRVTRSKSRKSGSNTFESIIKPPDFTSTISMKKVKIHQVSELIPSKECTDTDSNDSESNMLFIDDKKLEDHHLLSAYDSDTPDENLQFSYEVRSETKTTPTKKMQKLKTAAERKSYDTQRLGDATKLVTPEITTNPIATPNDILEFPVTKLPKKLQLKYKLVSSVSLLTGDKSFESLQNNSEDHVLPTVEQKFTTLPAKFRHKLDNSRTSDSVTIDLSKCKNTVKTTAEKLGKRLEIEIKKGCVNVNDSTPNKAVVTENMPLNLRIKTVKIDSETAEAIDLTKREEKTVFEVTPKKEIKILSNVIISPSKQRSTETNTVIVPTDNDAIEIISTEDTQQLLSPSLIETPVENTNQSTSQTPTRRSFLYEAKEIDEIIDKYTKDDCIRIAKIKFKTKLNFSDDETVETLNSRSLRSSRSKSCLSKAQKIEGNVERKKTRSKSLNDHVKKSSENVSDNVGKRLQESLVEPQKFRRGRKKQTKLITDHEKNQSVTNIEEPVNKTVSNTSEYIDESKRCLTEAHNLDKHTLRPIKQSKVATDHQDNGSVNKIVAVELVNASKTSPIKLEKLDNHSIRKRKPSRLFSDIGESVTESKLCSTESPKLNSHSLRKRKPSKLVTDHAQANSINITGSITAQLIDEFKPGQSAPQQIYKHSLRKKTQSKMVTEHNDSDNKVVADTAEFIGEPKPCPTDMQKHDSNSIRNRKPSRLASDHENDETVNSDNGQFNDESHLYPTEVKKLDCHSLKKGNPSKVATDHINDTTVNKTVYDIFQSIDEPITCSVQLLKLNSHLLSKENTNKTVSDTEESVSKSKLCPTEVPKLDSHLLRKRKPKLVTDYANADLINITGYDTAQLIDEFKPCQSVPQQIYKHSLRKKTQSKMVTEHNDSDNKVVADTAEFIGEPKPCPTDMQKLDSHSIRNRKPSRLASDHKNDETVSDISQPIDKPTEAKKLDNQKGQPSKVNIYKFDYPKSCSIQLQRLDSHLLRREKLSRMATHRKNNTTNNKTMFDTAEIVDDTTVNESVYDIYEFVDETKSCSLQHQKLNSNLLRKKKLSRVATDHEKDTTVTETVFDTSKLVESNPSPTQKLNNRPLKKKLRSTHITDHNNKNKQLIDTSDKHVQILKLEKIGDDASRNLKRSKEFAGHENKEPVCHTANENLSRKTRRSRSKQSIVHDNTNVMESEIYKNTEDDLSKNKRRSRHFSENKSKNTFESDNHLDSKLKEDYQLAAKKLRSRSLSSRENNITIGPIVDITEEGNQLLANKLGSRTHSYENKNITETIVDNSSNNTKTTKSNSEKNQTLRKSRSRSLMEQENKDIADALSDTIKAINNDELLKNTPIFVTSDTGIKDVAKAENYQSKQNKTRSRSTTDNKKSTPECQTSAGKKLESRSISNHENVPTDSEKINQTKKSRRSKSKRPRKKVIVDFDASSIVETGIHDTSNVIDITNIEVALAENIYNQNMKTLTPNTTDTNEIKYDDNVQKNASEICTLVDTIVIDVDNDKSTGYCLETSTAEHHSIIKETKINVEAEDIKHQTIIEDIVPQDELANVKASKSSEITDSNLKVQQKRTKRKSKKSLIGKENDHDETVNEKTIFATLSDQKLDQEHTPDEIIVNNVDISIVSPEICKKHPESEENQTQDSVVLETKQIEDLVGIQYQNILPLALPAEHNHFLEQTNLKEKDIDNLVATEKMQVLADNDVHNSSLEHHPDCKEPVCIGHSQTPDESEHLLTSESVALVDDQNSPLVYSSGIKEQDGIQLLTHTSKSDEIKDLVISKTKEIKDSVENQIQNSSVLLNGDEAQKHEFTTQSLKSDESEHILISETDKTQDLDGNEVKHSPILSNDAKLQEDIFLKQSHKSDDTEYVVTLEKVEETQMLVDSKVQNYLLLPNDNKQEDNSIDSNNRNPVEVEDVISEAEESHVSEICTLVDTIVTDVDTDKSTGYCLQTTTEAHHSIIKETEINTKDTENEALNADIIPEDEHPNEKECKSSEIIISDDLDDTKPCKLTTSDLIKRFRGKKKRTKRNSKKSLIGKESDHDETVKEETIFTAPSDQTLEQEHTPLESKYSGPEDAIIVNDVDISIVQPEICEKKELQFLHLDSEENKTQDTVVQEPNQIEELVGIQYQNIPPLTLPAEHNQFFGKPNLEEKEIKNLVASEEMQVLPENDIHNSSLEHHYDGKEQECVQQSQKRDESEHLLTLESVVRLALVDDQYSPLLLSSSVKEQECTQLLTSTSKSDKIEELVTSKTEEIQVSVESQIKNSSVLPNDEEQKHKFPTQNPQLISESEEIHGLDDNEVKNSSVLSNDATIFFKPSQKSDEIEYVVTIEKGETQILDDSEVQNSSNYIIQQKCNSIDSQNQNTVEIEDIITSEAEETHVQNCSILPSDTEEQDHNTQSSESYFKQISKPDTIKDLATLEAKETQVLVDTRMQNSSQFSNDQEQNRFSTPNLVESEIKNYSVLLNETEEHENISCFTPSQKLDEITDSTALEAEKLQVLVESQVQNSLAFSYDQEQNRFLTPSPKAEETQVLVESKIQNYSVLPNETEEHENNSHLTQNPKADVVKDLTTLEADETQVLVESQVQPFSVKPSDTEQQEHNTQSPKADEIQSSVASEVLVELEALPIETEEHENNSYFTHSPKTDEIIELETSEDETQVLNETQIQKSSILHNETAEQGHNSYFTQGPKVDAIKDLKTLDVEETQVLNETQIQNSSILSNEIEEQGHNNYFTQGPKVDAIKDFKTLVVEKTQVLNDTQIQHSSIFPNEIKEQEHSSYFTKNPKVDEIKDLKTLGIEETQVLAETRFQNSSVFPNESKEQDHYNFFMQNQKAVATSEPEILIQNRVENLSASISEANEIVEKSNSSLSYAENEGQEQTHFMSPQPLSEESDKEVKDNSNLAPNVIKDQLVPQASSTSAPREIESKHEDILAQLDSEIQEIERVNINKLACKKDHTIKEEVKLFDHYLNNPIHRKGNLELPIVCQDEPKLVHTDVFDCDPCSVQIDALKKEDIKETGGIKLEKKVLKRKASTLNIEPLCKKCKSTATTDLKNICSVTEPVKQKQKAADVPSTSYEEIPTQQEFNPLLQQISYPMASNEDNMTEFSNDTTLANTSSTELDTDLLPNDIMELLCSFLNPNGNVNINNVNWIPPDQRQQSSNFSSRYRDRRTQAISIVSSRTISTTITNYPRKENVLFSPEQNTNGGIATITSKQEITLNFNGHRNQNNSHGISTNDNLAMEHCYSQGTQMAGNSGLNQLKAIKSGTNDDHNYNTRDPVMSMVYNGDDVPLNYDNIFGLDLPEEDDSLRRGSYPNWDPEPKVIVVPNEQYSEDTELKDFDKSSAISETIDDSLVVEPWDTNELIKNEADSLVNETWNGSESLKSTQNVVSNQWSSVPIKNIEVEIPFTNQENSCSNSINNQEAHDTIGSCPNNLYNSILSDSAPDSYIWTEPPFNDQHHPEFTLPEEPLTQVQEESQTPPDLSFYATNFTSSPETDRCETPQVVKEAEEVMQDEATNEPWDISRRVDDKVVTNVSSEQSNSSGTSKRIKQLMELHKKKMANNEMPPKSKGKASNTNIPGRQYSRTRPTNWISSPDLNKKDTTKPVKKEDVGRRSPRISEQSKSPNIVSPSPHRNSKTNSPDPMRIKSETYLETKTIIPATSEIRNYKVNAVSNSTVETLKDDKTNNVKEPLSHLHTKRAKYLLVDLKHPKLSTKSEDVKTEVPDRLGSPKHKPEQDNNTEKPLTDNTTSANYLSADVKHPKLSTRSEEVKTGVNAGLKNRKYKYEESNNTQKPLTDDTTSAKYLSVDIHPKLSTGFKDVKTGVNAGLASPKNRHEQTNNTKQPLTDDTTRAKYLSVDVKHPKLSTGFEDVKTEVTDRLENRKLKHYQTNNTKKPLTNECTTVNVDVKQPKLLTRSHDIKPTIISNGVTRLKIENVKYKNEQAAKYISADTHPELLIKIDDGYQDDRLMERRSSRSRNYSKFNNTYLDISSSPMSPSDKSSPDISSLDDTKVTFNLYDNLKLRKRKATMKRSADSSSEKDPQRDNKNAYEAQSLDDLKLTIRVADYDNKPLPKAYSNTSSYHSVDKLLGNIVNGNGRDDRTSYPMEMKNKKRSSSYEDSHEKRKSQKCNDDVFDELWRQESTNPYFSYSENQAASSASKNQRYESTHSTHRRSSNDSSYSKRRPSGGSTSSSNYWRNNRGTSRSSQRYPDSTRSYQDSGYSHPDTRSSYSTQHSFRDSRDTGHFSRKSTGGGRTLSSGSSCRTTPASSSSRTPQSSSGSGGTSRTSSSGCSGSSRPQAPGSTSSSRPQVHSSTGSFRPQVPGSTGSYKQAPGSTGSSRQQEPGSTGSSRVHAPGSTSSSRVHAFGSTSSSRPQEPDSTSISRTQSSGSHSSANSSPQQHLSEEKRNKLFEDLRKCVQTQVSNSNRNASSNTDWCKRIDPLLSENNGHLGKYTC
ncbi:unnamed protein product [Psylliodes chrysocephalus]|uniref:Uncharacterized protein n=1 Tax=Psylliodes chrysocephalus TaxID=3402493 RepID=A0A9P0G9X1_9CUCU|nr:unnamed protein product [Psylliodes chrysocephala]